VIDGQADVADACTSSKGPDKPNGIEPTIGNNKIPAFIISPTLIIERGGQLDDRPQTAAAWHVNC